MEKHKNVNSYANINDILFDQKSPVHWEAGFPRWHTHILTEIWDKGLELVGGGYVINRVTPSSFTLIHCIAL